MHTISLLISGEDYPLSEWIATTLSGAMFQAEPHDRHIGWRETARLIEAALVDPRANPIVLDRHQMNLLYDRCDMMLGSLRGEHRQEAARLMQALGPDLGRLPSDFLDALADGTYDPEQ